ncbi:hypothetical protein K502DRAFT_293437 [Neoconidiobolus thromboides FSU 785]|nr:hypothetical protein K502DRAFT_293437 [Neoconidiobolus thromboides FSU 785]
MINEYDFSDPAAKVLIMNFYFQSIDTSKKTGAIYINVLPSPGLLDNRYRLTETVTCDFFYKTLSTFSDGKIAKPVKLEVPILSGNSKDYPFEEFKAIFTILCTVKDELVPVTITYGKDIQSYNPTVDISPIKELTGELEHLKSDFTGLYSSDNALGIVILLQQPVSTKLFSIFLILVMWGLTISLSIVTFDIIFHRREVPPPILAIGTSMLFALPALRGSQPGVPFLGCLSDISGFFWCLALIALCSMLNIYAFTLRWRRPVISASF